MGIVRALIAWTVLVAVVLIVGFSMSEGEPVCEGPFILRVDDSLPAPVRPAVVAGTASGSRRLGSASRAGRGGRIIRANHPVRADRTRLAVVWAGFGNRVTELPIGIRCAAAGEPNRRWVIEPATADGARSRQASFGRALQAFSEAARARSALRRIEG